MCDVIFFSKFYWQPFWKGAGSRINWSPLDYSVVTGQDDKRNNKMGSPCLFSCHNADRYGYFGYFW